MTVAVRAHMLGKSWIRNSEC